MLSEKVLVRVTFTIRYKLTTIGKVTPSTVFWNLLFEIQLHYTEYLTQLAYCTVSDGTRRISLEDVLVFWTGASSVPPLGFPAPSILDEHQTADKPLSISFCSGDDGRLPYASTCGLKLWLPLRCELVEFERRLTMAFRDCGGFGKV